MLVTLTDMRYSVVIDCNWIDSHNQINFSIFFKTLFLRVRRDVWSLAIRNRRPYVREDHTRWLSFALETVLSSSQSLCETLALKSGFFRRRMLLVADKVCH